MSEDAPVASNKSAYQLWKGINMIGGHNNDSVQLLTTAIQQGLGAGREGSKENRSCLGRSPWGKEEGAAPAATINSMGWFCSAL